MSLLSNKTKYAIKALVVLGKNYGKEPMPIMKIAEEENIPKKFLELQEFYSVRKVQKVDIA